MQKLACFLVALALPALAQDRPNVLWITAEDHGPHMGAYGDKYATTPNVDALAAKGLTYRYAWSTAPVCAPARTTIISGIYPPALGAQHMRSMVPMPSYMKMYPQYLREAGYYVTNNSKEDYNLAKPGQVWDESSRQAHYRNRKPGQPFFAIFNFTQSHESQIRTRPHKQVHDPAGVRVPAYHPDTPEVRQDWAQYYDKITVVDTLAGGILDDLETAGLADDTIVFYYADHGSGMPRGKRWTYNSGEHVPMIVHFPEKWKHLAPPEYSAGGKSDRLVGFIDLAPTLLSICGIEPPSYMQGHAFAGKYVGPSQPYLFGFRDRMDERYDMVRSMRDERYIYIRNYKPHKPWGQYIAYMFVTPTTRVWKDLYDQGKLNPVQALFWQTKPAEELYDLVEDPDESVDLVQSATHQKTLEKMRKEMVAWQMRIRDVGFLPEGEIHERSKGSTPYDMGHDDIRYPMAHVMKMAQAASMGEDVAGGFTDSDSAVRYWAAMGALMREKAGVNQHNAELNTALEDSSPYVQIIAAQALGQYGSDAEAKKALPVLLKYSSTEKNSLFISMMALNAVDAMDARAAGAKSKIAGFPTDLPSGYDRRYNAYVPSLIKKIVQDLD